MGISTGQPINTNIPMSGWPCFQLATYPHQGRAAALSALCLFHSGWPWGHVSLAAALMNGSFFPLIYYFVYIFITLYYNCYIDNSVPWLVYFEAGLPCRTY